MSRSIPALILGLTVFAAPALAGPDAPSDANCLPDRPVAPDPPEGTGDLMNEQSEAYDSILMLIKEFDGSDMQANEIANRMQEHYNTYYAGSMDPTTQSYGSMFLWDLERAMANFEAFKQHLLLKKRHYCKLPFPIGSCQWINGGVVFQTDPESENGWLDSVLQTRIMIGLQRGRTLASYAAIGGDTGSTVQLERELHCMPSPTVKPRFEVRISHEECNGGCVRSWIHIFDRKLGVLVEQYYIDHCPPIQGEVDQDDRWAEIDATGLGFAEALEAEITSYLKRLGERPERRPVRRANRSR